jgi:hypothetical protein
VPAWNPQKGGSFKQYALEKGILNALGNPLFTAETVGPIPPSSPYGAPSSPVVASASTNVLSGVQADPELRNWTYASRNIRGAKAQGPGIGIVAIGLGAFVLFMLTQKKRKKKR